MHNWFQCNVNFEKMLENGMQKKSDGTLPR